MSIGHNISFCSFNDQSVRKLTPAVVRVLHAASRLGTGTPGPRTTVIWVSYSDTDPDEAGRYHQDFTITDRGEIKGYKNKLGQGNYFLFGNEILDRYQRQGFRGLCSRDPLSAQGPLT